MSVDDLDNFEAERELQLASELQDVAAMVRYAIETERRFYLANGVDVTRMNDAARPLLEVVLTDAWVSDTYRTTRFVPRVPVLTFKDVNVEERPATEISVPATESRTWHASRSDVGAKIRPTVGTAATATESSSGTGG